MSDRKILVLDTSVLLYDMTAVHSFPGNDVVIPMIVLDELDRFKDRSGLLGESARYVNRYLDNLRKLGRLDKAIYMEENDQTVRVEMKFDATIPEQAGLDGTLGDNKIIATALSVAKRDTTRTVKVITKDINLRVKCDAFGLHAEDYYKDHIKIDRKKRFTGWRETTLSSAQVDKFYNTGNLDLGDEGIVDALYPNEFVVGVGGKGKSMLGTHHMNQVLPLFSSRALSESGIDPKNKEQRFALSMLFDPAIQLISLTGIAGSGKTFLTLMSAMALLNSGEYKRIVVTRSIQPVGRDLGYLPGDMNEKMHPWMAPFIDNFRHVFKDITYFDMMCQNGDIEIAPLAYMRGRTFNDSFVVVDEAQNASIHELKTIITRLGKDSKIVLLGDTDQVDTPYIDSFSNGLTITVERFKEEALSGHVHLHKGQRSKIASIASKIL
jgi:PhoH-like ATPase